MAKLIKTIITLFLLALVAITAVSCSTDSSDMGTELYEKTVKEISVSNEAETFLKLLSQGNYEKAQSQYFENIYGNYIEENDVALVCNQYYQQINHDFLNGDLDTSEAELEVNKIKKATDGTDIYLNETYDYEFEAIKLSKENFELGCSAYESGDYEKAIEYFSEIMADDSNYSESQNYISDAKKSLEEEYLNQAKMFYDNAEYAKAISLLNEAKSVLNDDIDIQAKIDEYSLTFVKNVIAQSDGAFVTPEKDWENALEIIKKAQQVLPYNEILQEKADYFISFQPVSLFDMHVFNSTDNYEIDSETDNMGNTYEKCMSLSHTGRTNDYYTGADTSQYMGAIYILDKKYNKLNFTVAVEGGNSSVDCYMTVEVYGDGKLLYDAGDLTQSTKPENIELDVTGVSELKAKIRYNGPSGGNKYIHNCREAIFAEPMLSKTVA